MITDNSGNHTVEESSKKQIPWCFYKKNAIKEAADLPTIPISMEEKTSTAAYAVAITLMTLTTLLTWTASTYSSTQDYSALLKSPKFMPDTTLITHSSDPISNVNALIIAATLAILGGTVLMMLFCGVSRHRKINHPGLDERLPLYRGEMNTSGTF